MKPFTFKRLPLVIVVLLTALTAVAADSNIDSAKSTLIATFKQENVPVEVPFRRFSGNIVYDAKQVATATAALEVETGSLDMGDEAYNAEVRKKSWFDSAAFPKATFRSTAVKPGAPGQFNATGTLTIKGKSVAVTTPIKVTNTAGVTAFDGTLVISRKAFGIGDPAWNDVLDDKVSVRFHLVSFGR